MPNGQEPDDDANINSTVTDSLSTNTVSLLHYVAKKLPLTLTLGAISTKFGIYQFAETLGKFLQKSGSLHPSLRHTIKNTKYPVFKQFTVRIPSPLQVSSEPFIHDVIHARVGEPDATVLTKPDLPINDNTSISWWDIKGKP